ncbi:uncharacterized protein LOC120783730 [Xiphias gladius]|uniref:uncharacterized protein LOC120783730 n=1 Tax=Xiphias gladius TaxID=8245 RepID=UPI001A99E8D7|nr:uncharacterized protein LOC120783730 [Xiphias gladius]
MASTPSASALSAVLRCRGSIWARNPPTKRPAASACSLGLAPPAEPNRSKQASAWDAFLDGERVVVAGGLTVAYRSPQLDGKMLRKEDFRESKKPHHAKPSHSPGDAHSALVPEPAHRLASDLPGTDKCSNIIQMIKHETYAALIREKVLLKEIGVLNVSITPPCFMESAEHFPSFLSDGWSALKSNFLSLTALVSEFMVLRLAVLWGVRRRPR